MMLLQIRTTTHWKRFRTVLSFRTIVTRGMQPRGKKTNKIQDHPKIISV